MSNEIDTEKILSSNILDTQQANEEAETIKKMTTLLEQMGISGKKAAEKINKGFSDTSSLKQYQKSLERLSAKTDLQKDKMNQLADAAEKAGKSFSAGVNHATDSSNSLDSTVPGIISGIGKILTQVSSAKTAVAGGASGLLGWGNNHGIP